VFDSVTNTWKRHREQQSKNMKLILLWLDSDQELNNKDIEDFLLFPTGIHAPLYDQGSRRCALSKLMNAAGILN
jgi:hypothetical protein